MSLDGLRAWIGEVERKLGVRTRVFLVLTVIAIGGAGAGIYLAMDARDDAVSEGDVQALQERLEARIGEGGGSAAAGAQAQQLEADLKALEAKVEQLEGEAGAKGESQGGGATGATGSSGTSSGSSETQSKSGGGASANGATGGPGSKLKHLLEQAKAQNTQAEQEQAGK